MHLELISVAARGIFRWGGKALENWVWSKIPLGATPKNSHCITLPPDSKIHFFNKKQIIFLQPGCFSIFCQIQSEMFLTFQDLQW